MYNENGLAEITQEFINIRMLIMHAILQTVEDFTTKALGGAR
jgi:hypothetical protein